MTDNPKQLLHRPIRDRLRIEVYLQRLDWHLEGSLSGTDRKAVVESLRHELMTDPRDLTASLSDLGSPQVLATRYADEEVRRPLWSVGIILGGLTLLVYWALFMSYTGGMLAAVDSAVLARAKSSFLFIQVEAFSTAEGFGIGWTSGWAWLVVPAVLVVVAFLAGARAWRALRRTH